MEDQLSALPNEIIIAILTMKEAARTSVLSLKWKNLWKFFTGSLNFDASKTKASMRQEIETMSLETERTNPFGVLSFNTLTSLCSKLVDLTEDVLAHFLSNCPLIEELSLMHSRSLVNLKIDGPQKLKYLELRCALSAGDTCTGPGFSG
ncbi:hypothetical protein TEA_008067 [Camellia sinensis var. sinensis]|uniref:At1g61320/AtMIF1 LRR domain-containing protein n=1 Tax=Camellia sinensis var. sinensis TaxID=542762 RepID=A0A4S4F149_CAMSN|nr:hypothetical protein TEA_008067 [Camellia sinensis var. sinensis]